MRRISIIIALSVLACAWGNAQVRVAPSTDWSVYSVVDSIDMPDTLWFPTSAEAQHRENFTSPELAYSTYIHARQRGDSLAVHRCWYLGWPPQRSRYAEWESDIKQDYEITQKTIFDSLEVTRRGYGGIGEVELMVYRRFGDLTGLESVFLVKVGDEWKIVYIK